jgi:uncharacterized membrane protein (Fun14 family)
MPKWWETKKTAWGEILLSIGIGTVLGFISPWLGIPIGLVLCCIGILLLWRAYLDKTKLEVNRQNITSVKEGSLDTVSKQDRLLIMSMALEMIRIHGYADINGLLADRANNVPLNELMMRKCSECNISRNERGNHYGL